MEKNMFIKWMNVLSYSVFVHLSKSQAHIFYTAGVEESTYSIYSSAIFT